MCHAPKRSPHINNDITQADKSRSMWQNIDNYISEILCLVGVFGVGLLNDDRQILLRPTPVAMVTKFQPKLAITRLA